MLRRLGKVLGHDLPKKLTMDPERLLFKFFHFIFLISDNQKRKKKCLINCIKYKAEPIPLGSSDSLEKKHVLKIYANNSCASRTRHQLPNNKSTRTCQSSKTSDKKNKTNKNRAKKKKKTRENS